MHNQGNIGCGPWPAILGRTECTGPWAGGPLCLRSIYAEDQLFRFSQSLPHDLERDPVPATGDFDITQVLKARYFFA